MNIYNYISESIKNHIIEAKEGCHHWLDYEILETLPDNLKERYKNQFEIPAFIYNPKKDNVKVLCHKNHNDMPGVYTCECTDKYPKTCTYYKKLMEMNHGT